MTVISYEHVDLQFGNLAEQSYINVTILFFLCTWSENKQYITLEFQLKTKTAALYLKGQKIYPPEYFIALFSSLQIFKCYSRNKLLIALKFPILQGPYHKNFFSLI